jgi:hypothetical protein
MTTEYIFQRDARSFVKNGNLSQGTAHWCGSFLRHHATGFDASEKPKFMLDIRRDLAGLPEGIPEGAFQFLDRPDLYTYGSKRTIHNVELLPFDSSRGMLKVLKNTTLVDGVLLADVVVESVSIPFQDYTQELIFQNPFRHLDLLNSNGTKTLKQVSVSPGTLVPVTDYAGRHTGLYRAVKVLVGSTAFPGDTGSDLTKFSAESLEIAPISGEFEPVLTDVDIEVTAVTIDVTAGTITLYGDPADILLATDNFVNNPIFTRHAATFGAARITGYTAQVDSVVLTITALKNDDALGPVVTYLTDEQPTTWSIYPATMAGCTRELPLFRYSLTAAYTYELGPVSEPQLPVIEFLGLSGNNVDGFGTVNNDIGREFTKIRTVQLETGWERKIVAFDRETTQVAEGRPILRFPGPPKPFEARVVSVSTTGVYSSILSSDLDDDEFQFTIFVPYTDIIPDVFSDNTSPEFVLTVDGTFSPYESWMNSVVGAGTITPTSAAVIDTQQVFNNELGSTITFVAYIPEAITVSAATWHDQTQAIADPSLVATVTFTLTTSAATTARIGDIALYATELTTIFNVVDDVAVDGLVSLDSNVSFDPLISKLDSEEAAIPKGTVVLYVGGDVCPGGFKRVNSFPEANSEGLLTIPLPDDITFLESENETELVWDSLSLPIADALGGIDAIEPLTTIVNVDNGNGTTSVVTRIVPQQQIQPGMTIRVPSDGSSDVSFRSGVEHKDINHFVTDVRPGIDSESGLATNTAQPANFPIGDITPPNGYAQGTITYPVTVAENLIDPPFQADPPFAPPLTEQIQTFNGDVIESFSVGSSPLVVTNGQLKQFSVNRFRDVGELSYSLNPSRPLNVGDVVWVTLVSNLSYSSAVGYDSTLTITRNRTGTRFSTSFAARLVSKINSGSGLFSHTFARYDGKAIFTPSGFNIASSSAQQTFSGYFGDGTTSNDARLFIRPIILYGIGDQLAEDQGQYTQITPQGITSVFTQATSTDGYWVIGQTGALGGGSLTIRVAGQVNVPSDVTELLVEPGGYLRYSEPASGLNYGAGGHSHKVIADPDNPYDQTYVPAYGTNLLAIPASLIPAASDHTHGYLSQYRYNLPYFRMFTACEKL